jgi:hypothetical protein
VNAQKPHGNIEAQLTGGADGGIEINPLDFVFVLIDDLRFTAEKFEVFILDFGRSGAPGEKTECDERTNY